jgi:sialate O-acetylesterase
MNGWRTVLIGFLVVAAMLLSAPVSAEIKLPSIIGDHMVLQRDRAVPVWGWDDAGAEVTVTMGQATATATADTTAVGWSNCRRWPPVVRIR